MTDTPPTEQERAEARILSPHLPAGYTAGFDSSTDEPGQASQSTPDLSSLEQDSSLKLQGGDIHRDLFKTERRAKLHQRAATFSFVPRPAAAPNLFSASEQRRPGGFRREFIQQERGRFNPANIPVTRNFVEFLELYGAFAGEDLEDSDDEAVSDTDEEEEGQGESRRQSGETRPLLGRRQSSKANRQGDAGTTKTFFTLLKAFVGTGIMFLPKAFVNGGMLFSSLTLLGVSVISLLMFHLLLRCRSKYGGGYGELGEAIVGPRMRQVILASITISQLGFVCAGVVFVAENLLSFLNAVTQNQNPLPTSALIAMQMVILVPLAFVRNISKLGPAALLADVFILIGLSYIYYYDIATISTRGLDSSVVLFNPKDYTMTVGSAIFTFEGIGLILPIQSSMKTPEKFERLLVAVMCIITVIFGSVGVLCYAAFGRDTQIEVINNFPQDSKLVNAVQFLYALAVLIGTPVQLFPPIRILEGRIFGRRSGKRDAWTKWKKNAFRTFLVVVCISVSILGSENLDRFVALIGSFACVPLVYIYPPFLHYKGIAEKRWVKIGDVAMIAFGIVGMIYTTCVTIANSFL